MRKLIIAISAILLTISCNSTKLIDKDAIKAAIADIEAYMDSLNRNSTIDPDLYGLKETRDSASATWRFFLEQCQRDDLEAAYDIYKDNSADFIIYLSHSTPRFAFITGVVRPLMDAYEHTDSIQTKYLDLLALEYYLEGASIRFSDQDNVYIPEVHPFVIIEYGKALNLAGRREDALDLAPELMNAVQYLSEDSMTANYALASYGAMIFHDSGEDEAALEILNGLKENILSWWAEESEDEEADEYFSYYLMEVEELITKYSSKK